jgi:hypothetical protein
MMLLYDDSWKNTPCVLHLGSSIRSWYTCKFGPLPYNVWLLHKCDNPQCKNLDHIFKGSSSDNCKDKEEKGRGFTGRSLSDSHKAAISKGMEGCTKEPMSNQHKAADCEGNSLLTEEQVLYIRSSHKSTLGLATELKVNYNVVYRVRKGWTWRHLL